MAIKKNTTVPAPEVNDRPTLNLTGATIQAAYQMSDTCIVFTLNIPGATGSPPRMRGKDLVLRSKHLEIGITPACAWKSYR